MARPRRNYTGFFLLDAPATYGLNRPHVNASLEVPLATTLMLLCAASTPSARLGGFSSPAEALDDRGRRDAEAARIPSHFRDDLLCSPWSSATQTASALGLIPDLEPALGDIDPGRWTGMSFADIGADALSVWLADPPSGAPEGESMPLARHRIGQWIDGMAETGKAICAITHPMMVRAALAHVLAIDARATLAIDIAPLSRAVLSFNRQWRLQSIGPN